MQNMYSSMPICQFSSLVILFYPFKQHGYEHRVQWRASSYHHNFDTSASSYSRQHFVDGIEKRKTEKGERVGKKEEKRKTVKNTFRTGRTRASVLKYFPFLVDRRRSRRMVLILRKSVSSCFCRVVPCSQGFIVAVTASFVD